MCNREPTAAEQTILEYVESAAEVQAPCKYGHYHCAAWDGGPCSNEQWLLLPECMQE